MKITVVVDNNGHVLGTYSQPAQVPEGYPTFQIHGGPDDTVYELDLPAEYENIASADELAPTSRRVSSARAAETRPVIRDCASYR